MEGIFQARRPIWQVQQKCCYTMYYRYHSVLVFSLGPGSVVRRKRQKRGQIGKISASQAVAWGGGKDYLSARFTHWFFFPFSPNAEPSPRLTCSKVPEGHVPYMIKTPVVSPSHHQSSLSYYTFDISKHLLMYWFDEMRLCIKGRANYGLHLCKWTHQRTLNFTF